MSDSYTIGKLIVFYKEWLGELEQSMIKYYSDKKKIKKRSHEND